MISQADIRNPLSLLAHNQIAATQLIRRGKPLLIQASPHLCLLLFAIEAGDFLDLVKMKFHKNQKTAVRFPDNGTFYSFKTSGCRRYSFSPAHVYLAVQ